MAGVVYLTLSHHWIKSMLDEIKYNKPPIIEVVCEFRFAPSSSWDAAVPGLIYSQISDSYPKRKRLRAFQSQLGAVQNGFEQQVEMVDRVQFLRDDERVFMQIGTDFLAINHLAPYSSWEEFRPIVAQGFKVYQDIAKPTGLLRAGLRYINVINLPSVAQEKIALKDYFKFYPEFGHVIPEVAEFMMGAVSAFEGGRDALRLQMVSSSGLTAGVGNAEVVPADEIHVLLDMDYFLAQPSSVPIENAPAWIDNAHEHVLSIFENCLTDKLREVFKPRNE
jgi:uncharacterized protein (TIGR04255 family)